MWLVIALVMGATLTGCSTHTARTDGGYALPGDQDLYPVSRSTGSPDGDREKARSVQDFTSPFRFNR